jgi:hypothetical protein
MRKILLDLVRYLLSAQSTEQSEPGHAITSVYTCEGIEDVCMASLYHFLKLGHSTGSFRIPNAASRSLVTSA